MTDATNLPALRTAPTNVADALERLGRIRAMRGWLDDLETPLRDYVGAIGVRQEQTTGASFRAPVKGVGLAYYDDPSPTVKIVDEAAFGRWYVSEILGDDPDVPFDPLVGLILYDDHVGRKREADVSNDALIAFVDGMAQTLGAEDGARYADALAEAIDVRDVWLIPADLPARMVDGEVHAIEKGKPRLRAVPIRCQAVDTVTGEPVPGVEVTPPRPQRLTVKPDADFVKRVRAEVDERLGRPELVASPE